MIILIVFLFRDKILELALDVLKWLALGTSALVASAAYSIIKARRHVLNWWANIVNAFKRGWEWLKVWLEGEPLSYSFTIL